MRRRGALPRGGFPTGGESPGIPGLSLTLHLTLTLTFQESLAGIGAILGHFPTRMVPHHLAAYFTPEGEPRGLHETLVMQEAVNPDLPAHLRERRRLDEILGGERGLATLCNRMLAIDPAQRCSMEEALRMPFLC